MDKSMWTAFISFHLTVTCFSMDLFVNFIVMLKQERVATK